MSVVKAEHITKSYGENQVLKDISIHLEKGELVSLLGVSGSGKTTLFHILSGLVTPEEGKVYLNDKDVTSSPGSISYMLQKDLLLEHKKVIDNVSLPLVLKGMKKKEAGRRRIRFFQSSDWKEHSISIRISYLAECGSVRRFFERICLPVVWHFWMNRSAPWTP